MSDSRQAAVERLVRFGRQRGAVAALSDGPRPGAETALVLGTLRRRATLDAVLSAYSTRKLLHLRPETLWTMRVGLFELVFMDDAPPHAVINAAVGAARKLGRFKDLGFVNAVLRQILRSSKRVAPEDATDPRRSLPRGEFSVLFQRSVFPDRNHDAAAFLAARASTAGWIAARRLDELGFDRALICLDLQAATPRMFLRPAPGEMESVRAVLAEAGIPVGEGPHEALLALGPKARASDVFECCGDRVVVQDAVASQVAPFCRVERGWRVLDYCAAPGGKATHLAQLVGPEGSLRAWDTSEPRLALVAENASRLGLEQLICGPADGEYDAVLVDAPCSNTGVLARRPEARWRVKERHLPGMAQRQLRILKDAAVHVGPGKSLVYSTCSLEPEENGGVVQAFLERGEFRLEQALTIRPDEGAGDGGFMARMRRV